MRAHQAVRTPAGRGTITSGGFAPTLNRSIALVRLPAAVTLGSVVEVEVHAKWLQARTVKPPFVRRGTALISMEV
jgi:aminomethyltransferase